MKWAATQEPECRRAGSILQTPESFFLVRRTGSPPAAQTAAAARLFAPSSTHELNAGMASWSARIISSLGQVVKPAKVLATAQYRMPSRTVCMELWMAGIEHARSRPAPAAAPGASPHR